MAGSGAEEWIIAGSGRGELRHHRHALVAHRRHRDHPRVVFRNDAFVVVNVLVDGFHLTGIHQHPVVARAQELAAVVKGEPDHRAARAHERVGLEGEEVAVGFDEQIDGPLLGRRGLPPAANERQRSSEEREQPLAA